MDLHAVIAHVESDIRHMQKVIGEVFLDEIPLVTSTDDKIIDAMRRIYFQDVPEDGATTNFHHRLGSRDRLLG